MPLSPIEEEYTDAASPISDAATQVEDDWETCTLVGDDEPMTAPERPVSPPIPTTEGRQPYRRTPVMACDDDLYFGDIEVRLVPAIGRIVDLIRIYGAPHSPPPPTPVIRPTPSTDTARIPLFRLDGGAAPFTIGGVVHIRRGVAYICGPPPRIPAQRTPVGVEEEHARLTAQRQPLHAQPGLQVAGENHVDRARRGEYHTSMIPPVLGHNEPVDEFGVRLRRHMRYVRAFARSAGLDNL
ncbi:hypothetical protein CLCR_01704 [Cladophialophora carrionii]|uniref:Uncharacterized protein n=1 Tax=Cladophialophora carrionii TaxID=86049 RepID=A0A1C1CAX4_9EURO|nr:hypothetical protein CLCR_01704 [Cladophialophora carrionii]